MEALCIAVAYFLLFAAGFGYLVFWNSRREDHSSVEQAWQSSDDQKRKEAEFWSQQFEDASKRQDNAKLLS
ncbi:MAG: hypothetical protein WBL82_11225, partial [Terriglobales bacterium]